MKEMKKTRVAFAIGISLMLFIVALLSPTAYSINMETQNDNPLNSGILDRLLCDAVGKSETSWYYKPSSYAELVGWYQKLESEYPDYIEVFKANEMYNTGTTSGGYDAYYVRITNESLGLHKPEVLFLGSPHGDETAGTIGLYWFTDWLMRMAFTEEHPAEGYSEDWLRWMIDHREIYIEVAHNPYGFDHNQRYDRNGWDLNREADYDGPGSPTGGIWRSVPGKTMVRFVNNHTIRTGCDFHGGARMLLYPWADTHYDVSGTSPITGTTYGHSPPDFYYFDVASLRIGDYMGDYGGNFNAGNVGPIHEIIWYSVKGGMTPWGYGSDVEKNPVEDPYVEDENFGNYHGAGILWITPEMSDTKNIPESEMGNDAIHRYGAEVRRYCLLQTDLAQPYVLWQSGTVKNDSMVDYGTLLNFTWQVNGSLVVDHTYIQYGTDPDPINNPEYSTVDYNKHEGDYYGGTGWDNAEDGKTEGVVYSENFTIDSSGDYYFVAKAQVDQVYADVLRPDIYGDDPYLRIIKERTNGSYYEMINGTDGEEEIIGQSWWYSPIIHVTVNTAPEKPEKPSGPDYGKTGVKYLFSTRAVDPNDDQIYYMWDWGDGNVSDWMGPYNSGETTSASHQWDEKGTYSMWVKAKDIYGEESDWSEPLEVSMPKNTVRYAPFLEFLHQYFPRTYSIIQHILTIDRFIYDTSIYIL